MHKHSLIVAVIPVTNDGRNRNPSPDEPGTPKRRVRNEHLHSPH